MSDAFPLDREMGAARGQAALELDGISRTFIQGESCLDVLQGADLVLKPGEIVSLLGPSGAGKSTLLQIAGLLERPDGGEVRLNGIACSALGDSRRTGFRLHYLGFVYQFHHLLPEFSALENVVLPQLVAEMPRRQAVERASELLEAVGLNGRESHRPAKLSGGEQQRVAIARALANRPRLLLADEPTGNLDQHTADGVFDVLVKVTRSEGLAALIATHNIDLARRMDRAVRLDEGRLIAA